MAASAAGFKQLKLFPAVPAGGVGMLDAMHGPLPEITFCPTGGISLAAALQFFGLPECCVRRRFVADVQRRYGRRPMG